MELSDDSLRSIVAHLAHVRSEYGEVLGDADLIEPNGEYFPDEFKLEPVAIDRLMRRMMTYAPRISRSRWCTSSPRVKAAVAAAVRARAPRATSRSRW